MQHSVITFDLETISTRRQDVKDYIAKTIKPPKTMSVQATIDKWHKESKQAAIEDAINSTGLDGAFGEICCAGLAFDDEEPIAINKMEEADILRSLNKTLDNVPPSMHSAVTLVGFNCISFDIRFLFQRYVVNSIRPHPIINAAVNAKAWDIKVFDCMTQFAGYQNRISLDKLCLALNIPSPKGEMEGSMVNQFYLDGRHDEIALYCKRDVAATYSVYKRLTFK